MLTEHTVAEAAAAAGIDAPARFFESVGSTNTVLLEMAEQGAPDWTVVAAGQQESGRGRLGRTWISPPGSSLLVSVLLRPDLAPAEAPVITLAAGVSMAGALAAACGVAAMCKWPNDLMVGERKIGGILVEAKVEGCCLAHAVIGAGVNLRQEAGEFPPEEQVSATSVALEGGRPDSARLLRQFLERLKRLHESAAFRETALAAYEKVSATIGREVAATTVTGATVRGRAVGIGESGDLLVRTEAGVERVAFGEVEHLR